MGDECLVTGEAKHLQESDPAKRRVVVVDRHNRPRWHPLWEGNPRIVKPGTKPAGERWLRLENAAWSRPYIDWHRMRAEFAEVHGNAPFTTKRVRDRRLPWRFTKHRARRGELFLPTLGPTNAVVIEPSCKFVTPNRNWGVRNWQKVVDALPDVDWLQINRPGEPVLRGARHIPAATPVEACIQLSAARLYVGPEGGLYHAAAALGIRSVAIFGGYVSPDNQGYDDCVNLYEPMGGESPCGQRIPCGHCGEALARITPDRVIAAVEEMLA
jgi:ADP-heptose:LPS heptosyltransferase